jgi:autotransporter-associated beta strand protein
MAGTNNLTLTGKISGAQTAVYLTSSLDAGRLLTLGAIDISTSTGNRDFYLQGKGDTLITGVIDDGGTGTNRMHFINRGTTTLRANNAYALDTQLYGGGTLVLDYTSDESRLPDIPLYLAGPTAGYGGGDLMLKGGSYVEVVSNVTFEGVASGGGHYNIQRTSGSSVLRMDTILRTGTRYNTLNFSDDSIADTDTTNINGILAVSSIPFATVGGTDWAYNSTGGADGPIMKLPSGSYTALPASGGSNTVNYIQTGSATLSGTNTGFTLKLVSSGSGQSLDIGANNLNISGGLLYAGGGDGLYTITGSGTVMSGTTEANLYVNSGCTLTLDAPTVNANKALMKSGAGRLILNKASANSAALFVNEGAVRLRNDTAAGTTANGIFVCASPAGSALELAPDAGTGNPISVGAEALSLAGNGVSNGGALRNISGNNTYAGAVTIRLQGARINSDAGTLAITGGVVTASGQDVTFGGAGNVTVNTGAISSGGAVTKDGAGTLTLASSNTYTGPTTVNAGTLKVTGSIAAGSRVTVNSGATLSGSGTCYGEVWVRNGGTIKPEGGDLTVGSLILGNGATASVAAGGNKIVVSSTGALSDTLGLTICPGAQVALEGTHTAGTYDVFQYSGTIKGSVTNLALANPAGGRTYTFGTSGGVVRVTVAGGAGMLLMVK